MRGQDIVAGAVEDSVDAGERIAGQTLAQRLHDRDGAADGGFEIQRHLILLGHRCKADAVTRQQGLVGGDHRFLRRQRRRDRRLGGVALSAHQLDEDVDLGIGRQRHRIGHPARTFAAEVAFLAA